MSKKRLIIGAVGALVGYYYASQPNDGTSNSPPLASIMGTVLGTIPQALGLSGTTWQAAYAVEGGLIAWFLAKHVL